MKEELYLEQQRKIAISKPIWKRRNIVNMKEAL